MARRSLFFLPVVMLAVVVASASASTSARDPLSERMQLTKADNALASKVSIHASDLAPGWKPGPTISSAKGNGASSEQGTNACPGYRPNLSSITLTGHQERSFHLPDQGVQVDSLVEVYATLEQTRKDWKLSITSAAAKCWSSMVLRNEPSVRLVSARLSEGPRMGEDSARFTFVYSFRSKSGPVPLHRDLLIVRQGRVIAGLSTTSAVRSAPGQEIVLSRMVSRMEKPAS